MAIGSHRSKILVVAEILWFGCSLLKAAGQEIGKSVISVINKNVDDQATVKSIEFVRPSVGGQNLSYTWSSHEQSCNPGQNRRGDLIVLCLLVIFCRVYIIYLHYDYGFVDVSSTFWGKMVIIDHHTLLWYPR